MSNRATVTAVFRNGIFTPEEPVSLPEGTRVRLNLTAVYTVEEDEDLLKLGRETDYFVAHQSQLQALYPNQYIAIHNAGVIDHDSNKLSLSLRLLEKMGEEAILVKHVDEKPIPEYFMRSPRLEHDA